MLTRPSFRTCFSEGSSNKNKRGISNNTVIEIFTTKSENSTKTIHRSKIIAKLSMPLSRDPRGRWSR
jgi:hypothetical protein